MTKTLDDQISFREGLLFKTSEEMIREAVKQMGNQDFVVKERFKNLARNAYEKVIELSIKYKMDKSELNEIEETYKKIN